MGAVVGIGLLASLTVFESIASTPPVEPVDTTAWLAAADGDTLIVTDTTGQERSGAVVGISPDTLSMWTAGGVFDIDRRDVRLVRQRFADPLGDGTAKGLWVGLGSAFLMHTLARNDIWLSDLTSVNTLRFMSGVLDSLNRRDLYS